MKILFNEIRFPTDIAYGAIGGPEFFTDVITSSNGFEQRNINWIHSRNRYNLAPAIKTKEQLEYLISFFRLCKGKGIGFRFKDWADFNIQRQEIAIGDGEREEFQLIKIYNIDGVHLTRKIVKPIKDSLKIYLNGNLLNPIISDLGVIKFIEAPAEGDVIEAEGEFDVPVRFDTDYLATSIEDYGVYSHQDIPLVELKYA